MSNVLQIFQYQAVNFTDTTTGAGPFGLSWSFPGGIPLSGTSSTETVFYNVPGTYTVSLTATDVFGTSKTLVESNIIQVDPSTLVGGITGPFPSSVFMDQSYAVYDGSFGNPYPATSWLWSLPAGQTAGTQNVTVNGYGDWYVLTGTYFGSPGSSFTGSITLTASNGFNSSSAATTIEVQKLGPPETLYINLTGGAPTSGTVVTGFSGSLPISVGPIPIPAPPYPLYINTTEFGYPVSYPVAKMDFSLRGSSNKTNLYFHSTNESAGAIITSGLWDASTFLDTFGGFLVVDSGIYTNYSSIPSGPEITNGNYVTGGMVSEFFIADETGLLQSLYQDRNYGSQLLNYLLSSPYKNLHSGNLQYLNANPPSSPITQMTFVDTTNSGASGSNPMVYSSNYLTSLGPTVPPNPVYEVYVTISVPPSTTYGATATFGSPGSTGNYGDFFVAQNTPNGVGIASILNSAINSAVAGGTGFVEFIAASSANCDYSSPTGPGYDPTNYYGLIAVFRNDFNASLYTVSISDNSSTINGYYTPPLAYPIASFTADFNNTQNSYQTCSGLYPISVVSPLVVTLPLTPPFSSITFGGTIGYP